MTALCHRAAMCVVLQSRCACSGDGEIRPALVEGISQTALISRPVPYETRVLIGPCIDRSVGPLHARSVLTNTVRSSHTILLLFICVFCTVRMSLKTRPNCDIHTGKQISEIRNRVICESRTHTCIVYL